ncbi:unnamed protein product [Didymodactylos carnosus]|uniref:Uncharacterized protein n=1 Tax=Didymodactylos carnosus TaxID=1234261 RepID=A0A815WRY5_9BILA|nr:unnamed protein product [Didymodactylos carnosus]CAF1548904.1 unnamed protein product [Didymodactylos carnosus]CAF3978208.1 unnamed protein product [Didymodactylos carnosus]CAF4409784.1 unnamed protein product [Didymodactylos carnosus]
MMTSIASSTFSNTSTKQYLTIMEQIIMLNDKKVLVYGPINIQEDVKSSCQYLMRSSLALQIDPTTKKIDFICELERIDKKEEYFKQTIGEWMPLYGRIIDENELTIEVKKSIELFDNTEDLQLKQSLGIIFQNEPYLF